MPNIVGYGNTQIPTNAMLGDLAYQDSVSEVIIDKIKARTDDTAVDIFVYDTRKDSDGGAWRHRTQNTSWYNEGASSKRGDRKEFPAVAVIVCLSNHIKIYDGDDPNLSLWMDVRGTTAARNKGWMYGSGVNAVTALNGIIAIAANWNIGDEGGLLIMDFVKDELRRHESSAGRAGGQLSISQRGTSANLNTTQDIPLIVDPYVRDVAMTVLPNAPIDASTGLPTPTIAVATNGGFSIIKDDGTVIDKGVSSTVTNEVDWYKGQYLLGTGPEYWALYRDFLIEESGGYISSTADLYSAGNNTTWDKPQPTGKETKVVAVGDLIAGGSATAYTGHVPGLSLKVPPPDLKNGNSSLLCEIRKDYNTGWMHGDIQGAFLSDTDDTDVTGTYLYLDNFSNNDKGWSFADNSGGGISGGVMTITTQTSARATDHNALTGVATGTKLLVKFTVTFGAAGTLSLDDDGAGAGVGGNTNLLVATRSGSGTQTFTSIYTKTGSDRVRFIRSSGGNFQIDNFEMKILPEKDRSISDNGLAVYGTITKSPVATGAELVAYSGFSASNYLQQPYNSDLDFGTGNWSFMFWYNANNAEQGDVLFTRWSYNLNSSSAGRIGVYFHDGNLRCDTTDDGASSYQGHSGSDGTQDTSSWHCGVVLRRGSNLEIWVDGNITVNNVLNSTSDGSYTNTSAILEIGDSPNMGSPDSGIQLTLLRVSASAPSPEQIKKIYSDEKCLFHENAKCTLYGTSNAITALAYDDTTNILYAGTSSGRSDFQGLNRINNTTTAVTTAISASNGLIAEQ